MSAAPDRTDGDRFVAGWQAELQRGLSLSGEDKSYFVRGRARWLRERLRELGRTVEVALDFGCGLGDACPVLREELGAREVIGVDTSEEMVAAATRACAGPGIRFARPGPEPARASVDLATCSGVFHHIPPPERPRWLAYLRDALRPGGLLALWENNPWNPGTRLIMARIPFDRDAVTLSPLEGRRVVRAAGFEVVRTDFLFFFPRPLRALRPLEPALSRVPLGAQYLVLARRP
jgi:SAM-dependent methyltransferase